MKSDETFAERVARLKAEQDGPLLPVVEHDEDLIPDIDPPVYPTDPRLEFLKNRPIQEVFIDFGLKLGHKTRQGCKIQCPDPTHGGDGDNIPSGSTDDSRNLWCCHACTKRTGQMVGGDIFELGAWMLPGFDPDSYRDKAVFPRLVDALGEFYGLEAPVDRGLAIVKTVDLREPPAGSDASTDADVLEFKSPEEPEEEVDFSVIPSINWEKILQPDTFWHNLMQVGVKDDLPLEYWFWLGALGIGQAVGRDVWLDLGMPVYTNLFICFYGTTGQGKSRPIKSLRNIIRKSIPFDLNDSDQQKGSFLIPDAESAQVLVDMFSAPIHEDDDPKKRIIDHHHIRGLWVSGELADLISKSKYSGSQLKPKLHQFHDCDDYISTKSRGHGLAAAVEPYLSMTATSQPSAIRQLLQNNDRDSGFANRWLFVIGHSRNRRLDPPIPDIDSCILPLQTIHEWCSGSTGFQRQIKLDPAAFDLLQEYFHEKIKPIYAPGGNNEMLTRLELTIKKLITLISANNLETNATVETVEAAISLHDYIVSCYDFLDRDLMTTERQEFYDAILRTAQSILDRTKKAPTKSQIYLNITKRFRDAGRIDQGLDALLNLGLIKFEDSESARGPKTKVIRPVKR